MDKRYHLHVQGFTKDVSVVTTSPRSAVAKTIMRFFSVNKHAPLDIESWPGEESKYEVSQGGQRVATVTIVRVDE